MSSETKSGRDKGQSEPQSEPLIVDGFNIQRSVSERWDLAQIRKAIAKIAFWYPDRRKLRALLFNQLLMAVLRNQDEEAKRQEPVATRVILVPDLRPVFDDEGKLFSVNDRRV